MNQPPAIHLDRWRALMGLNPWHFWQFAGTLAPMNGACGVTTEYGWQAGNAAGRAEVREALAQAETRLGDLLSVPLAPNVITDTVPVSAGYGWSPRLRLPTNPVLALGTPVYTLLGTVAVTYLDRDNDGLRDAWQAQLTTTETDIRQLFAVVPQSERPGDGTLDMARDTLPATITLANGTATLAGQPWTLGRPLTYQAADGAPLDPADDANFLISIAVYRRSFDTATAITRAAVCGCTTCTDALTGTLQLGMYGMVCLDALACGASAATVTYTAGLDWSLNTGWAGALARLAAAELAAPICACEDVNREVYRWQKDMALTGKSDEQFGAISAGDLQNPLGTRRGAITAYRYFLSAQPLGGIRAG